jgi:hypothetical protein
MITNAGKQIISKYLVGQTDGYAEYLAIGCGAKPLSTSDSFADYSLQKALNFETLRVPIISKASVVEDDVNKIILTAELPTTERYEITEVGIYPSGTNPIPTGLDSQSIFLFNSREAWKYHASSSVYEIPLKLDTISDASNNIVVTDPDVSDKVFFTNSDNSLFTNATYPNRVQRHERPRFLNSTLLIRGDTSTLTASGSNLTVGSGSEHIHIDSGNIDFNKNSVNDELRLAFSVLNKNGGSSTAPTNVKVLIQFATADDGTGEYANFVVNLNNGTSSGQWDFTNNRYVVISKKLSELYKSSTNFSWDAVSFVKIFVSAGSSFFVALDALRIENVSSFSNVYGLTAYTVMKTSDALPIVKSDNTSNFIEFKYVVDVL